MDEDLRAAFGRVVDRFDFGEYEMEAYLAVLEHGRLSATEIAERTDVPQPRVYEVVRRLADAGLVELRESRPMQVLALDPREAFADLQTSLTTLVDDLEDRYTAPAGDIEETALISSRATILRHLESVVAGADYELVCSLSPALLERFEADLAERRADGVSIELLLSPAAEAPAPDTFDYDPVARSVRVRRGVTTPIVAVADGRRAVYAPRAALDGDGDRDAVSFDRSSLGFLVSAFLDTVLWPTAEQHAAPGPPEDFPRRYASIRRCIADLAADEGPFYASIVGRDVVSGDRRRVEGEVVEATAESGRETATLVVETASGRTSVGGMVAAYEDVEAHEIRIGRDEPPGL